MLILHYRYPAVLHSGPPQPNVNRDPVGAAGRIFVCSKPELAMNQLQVAPPRPAPPCSSLSPLQGSIERQQPTIPPIEAHDFFYISSFHILVDCILAIKPTKNTDHGSQNKT